MALGCDLTNIKNFDELLRKQIDLTECSILCIAEVSMTYMNVAAADCLIRWMAHFDDGILLARSNSDNSSLTPKSLFLPSGTIPT